MSSCPYCLAEVDEAALACRHCGRDLQLVRSLQARIAELEAQLAGGEVAALPEAPAAGEVLISAEGLPVQVRMAGYFVECFKFILVPLFLLLLGHVLVTLIYDLNPVYLRLLSMLLPLPFGFRLFRQRRSMMLPWFAGILCLAMSAVVGMSFTTSLVDDTPVWPQDAFEWREFLEYSASIAFSFLTGMLLAAMVGGRVSMENLSIVLKDVKAFGAALAAILSSLVTIYTGLKGLFGG